MKQSTTARNSGSAPQPDFLRSPCRMLSDQRVLIPHQLLQCRQIIHRSRISERHADIADEGRTFDALDRAFGKEGPELVISQAQEIAQAFAEHRFARLKSGLVRDLCKLVPGAGRQAVIAAINPVTHRAAKLLGNAAFALDRQVTDAAACIHALRGRDGPGRAGVHAARAFAAHIFGWRVGRHIQRRDQFGKKEPGA